jgi:cysteine desulfurase
VVTAKPIFLDGFSTLPLAPEAREAMFDAWDAPGNGGSANLAGERAARLIGSGRQAVAELIGAAPNEIIFTSGATEANNLALLGLSAAAPAHRRKVVVSAVEHKSVLEPARMLTERGFEVVFAPVDKHGRLDLAKFDALCGDGLFLASIMMVNNETGVIQPVKEAATIAHEHGGLFHSDAAQAVGKIAIDVMGFDIDYVSLSAHKCYGPMGVGALYVSAAAPPPSPLMFGGGQHGGLRPGTEPVALIAGFGAAARVAIERRASDESHVSSVVTALLQGLADRQLRFRRITDGRSVVPGSAAISIDGVDADALCLAVAHDVSISTGSACNSGQVTTSHVLDAIGFSKSEARTVVRFLCNRYTSVPEAAAAAEHIAGAAARSRLATGEVRQ